MIDTSLTVDLSTGATSVYASLGDLLDVDGNVVTDSVVSALYTLNDENVATIASQDGVGNASFDLTMVDGTEIVGVTGVTGSGSTFNGTATFAVINASMETQGEAPVDASTGPAVTVDIVLAISPPLATVPESPGTGVTPGS